MDGSDNSFQNNRDNGQTDQNGNRSNDRGSGYYSHPPYQTVPRNNFALASMVLGLASLLMLCTYVLSIPLGALSILFAMLSRKSTQRFAPAARTGIVTSVLGILIGLFFTVSVLSLAINRYKNADPATQQSFQQQFMDMMEQYLGEDFY